MKVIWNIHFLITVELINGGHSSLFLSYHLHNSKFAQIKWPNETFKELNCFGKGGVENNLGELSEKIFAHVQPVQNVNWSPAHLGKKHTHTHKSYFVLKRTDDFPLDVCWVTIWILEKLKQRFLMALFQHWPLIVHSDALLTPSNDL